MAAYPFFLVTLVTLFLLYPQMLGDGRAIREDRSALRGLEQQSWIALVLGASVPLLGIALLELTMRNSQLALYLLCGSGLVGFVALFASFRLIQRTLQQLQRVGTASRAV